MPPAWAAQPINPMDSKQLRNYIRTTFGFRPWRISLYVTALTHRSVGSDDSGHKINNERLEYLGDSVLGTAVAEYLYKRYPFQGEGFLTEMRSKIVSRQNLNELAIKIDLIGQMEYDRSQRSISKSMGGNAIEALVGAIYLDRGYRFTRRLILKCFIAKYMDIKSLESMGWNYKGKLLDWGQREKHRVAFQVRHVQKGNKHHQAEYEVQVLIDNHPAESATDTTIKAAEQLAAERTYLKLHGQK